MAAIPDPERLTGRRAYDTVSAEVVLAIEESVRDTRHTLRDEIAAVAAQVVAGNLQSTKEHAVVKATLDEVRHAVADVRAEVRDIKPRVAELEGHDRADDAVAAAIDKGRTTMRNWALGLGGLIVAATGVLAGILQH